MHCLAFLVVFLYSTSGTLQARDVPFLTGRVVDEASILQAETLTRLEFLLEEYEIQTSNQIVVLTIESLEDEVLEDYSLRVAETWALGQKEKDNGVLLLIAYDDRKVRIEVGYGLEARLTDARTRQIIEKNIVPNFKLKNFDAGIMEGITSIMASIDGTYESPLIDSVESDIKQESGSGGMIGKVLSMILGAGFFLFMSIGVFAFVYSFMLSLIRTTGIGAWIAFFIFAPLIVVMPTIFCMIFINSTMYFFMIWFIFFLFFLATRLIVQYTSWGQSYTRKRFEFLDSTGSHSSDGNYSSGGSYASGGFSGGGGSFGGGGSSGSW